MRDQKLYRKPAIGRSWRVRPVRVATLEEIERYGLDPARRRGLLPPIGGGSLSVPSGSAGQAAVHTLTSTATGGTWALTNLDGSSTAKVPFNASRAQLQAAINGALGTGLQNEITVGGTDGGPWTVTVPPNLIGQFNANAAFTVDNSTATGGTVVDAVTQQGFVGGDELKGSGQAPSEVPHIVGAAGQPAYATGWSAPSGSVALTVPVAAARTDWEPLQYYLDADGYVHIEGVAVWGAAAAALIFTLPAGYRPFQTHVEGSDVEVRADGTVSYMGSTASAGALDVGDVTFRPVGL